MPEPEVVSESVQAPQRRRLWLRRALWLGLGAALLGVLAERCYVFFGPNCHTIIPGQAYRCAQLSGAELERVVRKFGIRTVINLRGNCAQQDWYLEECRTTHRLDSDQEDIGMSAGRYPSTTELRYLVEVLDRTAYPILIHCKQGADRTGLVSALVLLLQSEGGLDAARRQLSLRYGHIALSRPANLDRFLELYAGWLEREQLPHSSTSLRQWLARPDCPMEYRCTLQPLDFPGRVPAGRPWAVHVRRRNDGLSPWHMKAEGNSGYHACFSLRGPDGVCVKVGRAGLFNAEVAPGQSVDLTLPLPALKMPGRHYLFVDMLDEAHCIFYQTGAEPLEWEFVVASDEK